MRALATVWLLGWVGLVLAQVPIDRPGRYVETFRVNGEERRYVLRVPKAYDGRRALPLVFVFHGWTANAEAAESYTNMAATAEREGFIGVFPDGLGRPQGWNAGFINLGKIGTDDLEFMRQMLDRIPKQVRVDPKRIFVCGHSNGGFFSHLVGSRLGDRIAAIGVIAGTSGVLGRTPRHIEPPVSPISVFILHGKLDPTVGYDASSRAVLKGTSAPDSARWWAEQLGARGPVRRASGNVVRETWSRGRNGTRVEFVTVENGGHDWPGGLGLRGRETTSGLDAAALLWEFFRANPKR